VKKIYGIMGLATIACGAAFAQQEDGKLQAESLAAGIATARFGVMGPAVKGAPYAADGVTETTQTLGDGTHIDRQETYSIYRDGEGRVRRESGEQVWISDPVANVSYVLNTKRQTARKLGLSSTVAFNKMQLDEHTAKLKVEARTAVPAFWFSTGGPGGADRAIVIDDGAGNVSKADAPKREALGKQEIEGVEADGTRTTTLIPQGLIGNDRPLQMVNERWESADLHVTVLSKRSDPRAGEFTERLTNVRRGEPDPALFQVPAGFKMESDQ
jgi:hypothetical protein